MTSPLGREQWREAGTLFHELVELDPSARSERLSQIGDTDPVLRQAIEALLVGDAIADQRLPSPGFGCSSPQPGAGADPLQLAGRTVSHFRVEKALGSGGMGVVYEAEDLLLHRRVALKFPLPYQPLPDSTRERFLREARSAGTLDHPNLCPVYEVVESPAGLMLAMPLYSGETLKERLARSGPLPVEEAFAIARQIAAGLGCAHAAGIVHRDIKPGNVMLLGDGTVKVLDFGLAKIRELDASASRSGLGTVQYMAPEQIRGDPVDERADLWALGVVLHEMLSGANPFTRDSGAATLHAILSQDPPSLSQLHSGIGPAVATVIRALLRKDPAARLQSAPELISAIDAIGRGEVPPLPRRPRRSRALAWAGLAGVLLLGTGGYLVLGSSRSLIGGARAKQDLLVPGWMASPDSQIVLDTAVVHSGRASVRLRGLPEEKLVVLRQDIRPRSLRGTRVRLKAWVRSDLSSGSAGLWMRMDGETPGEILAFDNMNTRRVTGRSPWTPYEVVLDVPANTAIIVFGAHLTGEGDIWVDDVSLECVDLTVPSTDLLGGEPQQQELPDSIKERILGARKAAGSQLRNAGFEQRRPS